MSFLMLTVRDAHGMWHGRFPGGFVQAIFAALSAEPETFDELETALGRFCDVRVVDSFRLRLSPGEIPSGVITERVVIDLPGRLVCNESTQFYPERSGYVSYHDGDAVTEMPILFEIGDEWRIRDDCDQWKVEADARRLHRREFQRLDVRQVLYGPSLVRYLAAEIWKSTIDGDDNPIRAIHAIWLGTPREDLNGQAPRDVLLARREEIDLDIECRTREWSALGRCPPGLPRDSQAYRFAGFGTHEIVLYYDLIRYLLTTAWQQPRPASVASEAAMAEWLEKLHDDWLTGQDVRDLHGLSPRDVIDLERTRTPWAIDSSDSYYDHDCPVCRMMAEEQTGPMFCHLDGSGMDDDYVFSFYQSVAEWEKEQAEFTAYVKFCEAKRACHEEEVLVRPAEIWSCSHLNRELLPTLTPGQRVYLLKFDLTANVAELRDDVSGDAKSEAILERVMASLGDVCDAVRDRAVWQLDGLIDTCGSAIDELRRTRSALADKCHDFRAKLELLRQSFQEAVPG